MQFEKQTNKLFNVIMHSRDHNDLIFDEDEVTKKEELEEEKESGLGTHKISLPTNQKSTMKIKLPIKRTVQLAPNQNQLSDCSPQKTSNCFSITKSMQRTTQSTAVVSSIMQKETQRIEDMEMKFESSKRKFEERLAEQRKAKRRTVMVDFNDMPKPADDSRAPKKHYWDRKKF